MALRIGLLRSSALQNDGLDLPVMLQCRTPRAIGGQITFSENPRFFPSLVVLVCLGFLNEGMEPQNVVVLSITFPLVLSGLGLGLGGGVGP